MTTLVVYPDASSGGASVDGHVRRSGVDVAFSTIHDAATGTNVSKTSTAQTMARLQASSTSNQYQRLDRGVATFDTSTIPAAAAISSATLTVYGTAKSNGLGAPDLDVVDVSLAATNDIVTGDYDGLGTTVYASTSYAGFSTSGANNFTLPTTSVVKEGVSQYGFRLSWDTDDTEPTWAITADTYFSFTNADNGSNRPTLTVEYTTGGAVPTRSFATIL